ncbi:MAG: histidine triad nucleotide-binding protein [Anaerosomatales bacterium]|nr:histidine triad nucleotide-binding protein [Anaerosomatales bacterium]
MAECIFCMVASGEIPANVVYEDDMVVAFDDIAPQGPVHTLIIPRTHYAHLGDDVPDELLGRLLAVVPKVAESKGIAGSGYRVIINTGKDASQTVHHLHVHVIGGKPMSHGMVNFADA